MALLVFAMLNVMCCYFCYFVGTQKGYNGPLCAFAGLFSSFLACLILLLMPDKASDTFNSTAYNREVSELRQQVKDLQKRIAELEYGAVPAGQPKAAVHTEQAKDEPRSTTCSRIRSWLPATCRNGRPRPWAVSGSALPTSVWWRWVSGWWTSSTAPRAGTTRPLAAGRISSGSFWTSGRNPDRIYLPAGYAARQRGRCSPLPCVFETCKPPKTDWFKWCRKPKQVFPVHIHPCRRGIENHLNSIENKRDKSYGSIGKRQYLYSRY